jgi:hypothetical protein
MNVLKPLTITFFVLIALTLLFVNFNRFIASLWCFIADIVLVIGFLYFLSKSEIKRIGRIKIEYIQFVRNFVARAFVKPKSLWIVYDSKKKLFRPADFRELPIRFGLLMIFAIILIYFSFSILITLIYPLELFFIRLLILFMFLTLGLYNLFVSVARLVSLENKGADKICNILNRKMSLKNFLRKANVFFEITPNFLFTTGFVTSVELVIPRKIEISSVEKVLIEIAKTVERFK